MDPFENRNKIRHTELNKTKTIKFVENVLNKIQIFWPKLKNQNVDVVWYLFQID